MVRVAILGDGRIARAVATLLAKGPVGSAAIVAPGEDLSGFDVLVGAMPGGLGPVALDSALKAGIDLIDLTDLETTVYEDRRAEVEARGIAVYPGAGFCPGLVNVILGRELALGDAQAIEVVAGSLSPLPYYFPFLWCFEDMVLEFGGESIQIIEGEKHLCSPFGGERAESWFGIRAESYFCQSGFENLASRAGLRNFTYRNLRPEGFSSFFRFLRNHGAFEGAALAATKVLLEGRIEDNISLASITVSGAMNRRWSISAQASADAELNSMQRLTAACAMAFLGLAVYRERRPGVHWCESLAADEVKFNSFLDEVRRFEVTVNLESPFAPSQPVQSLRPTGRPR